MPPSSSPKPTPSCCSSIYNPHWSRHLSHNVPAAATPVAGSIPVTVATTSSPRKIRHGPREGEAVDVRGRLSAKLFQAYEDAQRDAQKRTAGAQDVLLKRDCRRL